MMESKESTDLPQWDYRTLVIDTGSFLSRGDIDEGEIEDRLKELGKRGFELVSAVPVSDGSVGTRRLLFVLKRPASART